MTAERPAPSNMTFPDARHIIARADLHEPGVVLDACDLLERSGDWMDRDRAVAMRIIIARTPRYRAARRQRLWGRLREVAGDLVGAVSLVAIIYLFLLFTPG